MGEKRLAKRATSHPLFPGVRPCNVQWVLAVVVLLTTALPGNPSCHVLVTPMRLRGGHGLDTAVVEALQSTGLAHRHALFAQEGIRARNLPDLTADDLAEMGLSQHEVAAFLAHSSVQKPLDKQQNPGMQAGIPLNATVKEILASLGLEQYYETFQREGIHVRNLADLTSDDLAELGLTSKSAALLQQHCRTAARPSPSTAGQRGAQKSAQTTSPHNVTRAKSSMASAIPASSDASSGSADSKTDEQIQRLLTLLCGASEQAASAQLAALFWAHELWQRPLIQQLRARLLHTRWATREAAATALAQILASARTGEHDAAGQRCRARGGQACGIRQGAGQNAEQAFNFDDEMKARGGSRLWATKDETDRGPAACPPPKRQRMAGEPAGARGKTGGALEPPLTLTVEYTGGAGGWSQEAEAGDLTERGGWWPFDALCESLLPDLINEDWERRHGAARGIRLLITHHPLHRGTCAARPFAVGPDSEDLRRHELACENKGEWRGRRRVSYGETRAFVEACVAQLLRVLAFDRFSDYSGDMVVSPVREAAAQALAVALLRLVESEAADAPDRGDNTALSQALSTIRRMMEWEEEWEVRQSALLGLKYLAAIMPESCHQDLVVTARQVVLKGFRDVDDVRAVAADAALLLCRRGFRWLGPRLSLSGGDALNEGANARDGRDGGGRSDELTEMVWECLEECDEVACSTAPILSLLAHRLKSQQNLSVGEVGKGDEHLEATFGAGLSRLRCLLKFFRHNLASVRKATVGVLLQVVASHPRVLSFPVAAESPGHGSEHPPVFAEEALEVVYLNALIEVRGDLVDDTERLWRIILQHSPPRALGTLADAVEEAGHTREVSRLQRWLQAAATPVGSLLSPKDVCSSEDYLECISMFASYTARPPASADASLTFTEKSKGRGRGRKGQKAGKKVAAGAGAASVGNKYDVGSSTREVVCRMLGALLNREREWRQPAPMHLAGKNGSEEGPFGRLLGSSLASSDPWLTFAGTWVLLEMLSQPCDSAFDSIHCAEIRRQLSRPVEIFLARVVTSDGKRAGGLDRDTFAFAAGCLLLSRRPSEAEAQGRKEREEQTIEDLALSVLECLGQQADAILQRRNARVLAAAAKHRLLSPKAASQIVSEVCCDPSITPLTPSCLQAPHADAADKAARPRAAFVNDESRTRREISIDILLRNVPNCGDSPSSILQGDEYLAGLVNMKHRECRIRQRGAQMVLESAARELQEGLFEGLPGLWEKTGSVLEGVSSCVAWQIGGRGRDQNITEQDDEDIIRALHLAEVVLPNCARGVGARICGSAVGGLPRALRHMNAALRHMAARCLARIAAFDSLCAVQVLVRQVLPMFEEAGAIDARLGAAEAVYRAIDALRHDLLPYAVFLVTPVLSRMSDAHPAVREAATRCFASLLRVLPIEQGIPDPEGLPDDLAAGRLRERRFLEQLWNPSQLEPFPISANISASLRPYQLEGVNWLGFLVKYQLHGILCDDMGLGKTLQTIAVMASDVVNRRQRYAVTHFEGDGPLPSLVVCPSTLVQHWCHEVGRFCSQLKAVPYVGPPKARHERLSALRGTDDVLVVSYDALRNDVDKFLAEGFAWNFAVLDEGHIVKNPKSKTSGAVREVGLCAKHRLILTGTPIQNNVLELWGLFDFLMPSFLGSEALFNQMYSKPILASGRDLRVDRQRFKRKQGARATAGVAEHLVAQRGQAESFEADEGEAKVMEAADAALDKLHRQVLPFMLRRTKQQVLDDLPPKIIQDVMCPMTPLQKVLAAMEGTEQEALHRQMVDGDVSQGKALSALLHLKRVANHPLLVLSQAESGEGRINRTTTRELLERYHPGASPKDLALAPKMLTLKQLLCDCGIDSIEYLSAAPGELQGFDDGEELEATSDCSRRVPRADASLAAAAGGHRILIFSQMRAMLDLIERDLLQVHFPGLSYLRMDGSTPVQRRFGMQLEFNADPNVKVMLLTTHVGGLGLTLTGADTVIFVDHDWNPMRDLQAMDRAHRIGQTRTVNVYRLIAQGSLEERIMSLQSFKLGIANSVVSHENSKLASMDTSQALDLHNAQGRQQLAPEQVARPAGSGCSRGSRTALQKLRIGGQTLEKTGEGGAGRTGRVGGEQDDLWAEDEYADLDVDAFALQQGLGRILPQG